MPFEIIDMLDPLTALVEFRTSAVFELVLSIRTLLKPPRPHEAWAKHTTAALPADLLHELTYLYQDFHDGGMYFELPADYDDHSDVAGFFDYVRHLSDVDFVFYLLGRIISREELAKLIPDAQAIRAALNACAEAYEWYGRYLGAILPDIAGFRERLVNAWEAYSTVFFDNEVRQLEPIWASGIQEKQHILDREGGRTLLEKVTGRSDLPAEFPAGMPITSLTFIPVCLLPSRVYRFYGYGNVTILFDPQYTEERKIAIRQAKDEAMATLKALNDETRLEILRLIAQHHKGYALHGKVIAERVGFSASAVSRHLALLKDGELIAEEPQKNLITYRFKKETLADLTDKLLEYLYS
jgi:DNA-binding transcriptional ArsR family regulator